MICYLPKPKATKTPIREPHLAQLVGLQFYMTITPLTHSRASEITEL